MSLETIIIDGDWGGDEMQLAAVLLGNPDKVRVLGATAVFGSTPLGQVVVNAGRILHLLGAHLIPYFAGAAGPTGGAALEGDNAHGEDGLGGTALPASPRHREMQDAVSFIVQTLNEQPEKSVTITATGPLTNIAQALRRDPAAMKRVKRIIVMGGCTTSMPAHDMPERMGNITPYAEFNFYMAPEDAHNVLHSGLPIVLFPMNCTHQMTFTPERQARLYEALEAHPAQRDNIHSLMNAPHDIDAHKFNINAVMHDVHTAFYIIDPDAYAGRTGYVSVAPNGGARGRSHFSADPLGNVQVMETIKEPVRLYDRLLNAFQRCLANS